MSSRSSDSAPDRSSGSSSPNLLDSGNVYALITTLEEFQPDVCHLWNLVGIGGAALVGALEYLGVPWLWHLGDAVPAQICSFGGSNWPIANMMSERLIDGRCP